MWNPFLLPPLLREGWGGGKCRMTLTIARAPIPTFPQWGKEQEGATDRSKYHCASKLFVAAISLSTDNRDSFSSTCA